MTFSGPKTLAAAWHFLLIGGLTFGCANGPTSASHSDQRSGSQAGSQPADAAQNPAVDAIGAALTQTTVAAAAAPQANMQTICPGVQADISGVQPAGAQINACITNAKNAKTNMLQLPWGIYSIEQQIVVAGPFTLTTAGAWGQAPCFDFSSVANLGNRLNNIPCSMFVARPGLWTNGGMLTVSGSGAVVDHIFLNGNRGARINAAATASCQGGANAAPRGGGANASANSCQNCAFQNGGSAYAVCGSGMAWGGLGDLNTHIAYNVFMFNGDKSLVSDGLTLGIPQNSNIEHNYFQENSDVNLILFGGPGAQVHDNIVLHKGGMTSFAGIMLDNMDVGSVPPATNPPPNLGDFIGANVYNNMVNCSYGALAPTYYGCDIGIMVGPYAWYPLNAAGGQNPRIYGGTVSGNSVYHARQGLLMAGAGTQQYPTNVDSTNNVTASATPSSGGFSNGFHIPPGGYGCGAGGTHATSNYNADPNTVVNYAAKQPAWTFSKFEACY